MSDSTVIDYPTKGDILLYGTGLLIGVFSPGLFILVVETLSSGGLVGGYLGKKLEQIAGSGVTDSGAPQAIMYALLLIVAVLAVNKAAQLSKKLVIGVGVGIILRVVAIYVLGIQLPTSPVVDYSTPMDEAGGVENVTNNTSVQGFN